jgi:multidrug efflux system membrane fusion protein
MSAPDHKGQGVLRIVLAVVAVPGILLAGIGISIVLMKQRKPPATAEATERSLRVEVVTAHLEDVPVMIDGFGEARARDEVVISPEVSGRVIRVHPHLETGGVIAAGEEMFALDPRDYESRLADAEASVRQWESALQRTEKQFATDKERLSNYERIVEIAKRDFERAESLYSKDQIESETFAGNKESSYKQAQDAYDLLRQSIDLYPLRVEEARSAYTSSIAALEQAKLNLDRTIVRAPFNARIKEVAIEAGQWTTLGADAVTLADDSLIEISVALNSVDARNWLLFDETAPTQGRAWFGAVQHVPVEIAWTEAIESNQWQGTLDRVAKFDEETRTITVVVHVEGAEASSPRAGNLPLVEGMFCRVRIPGRVARGVVRLAAEAVGFDQEASGRRTVYVARKDPDSGRATLETRSVLATHNDGDYVYVSEGIKEGEQVITTRLVNPLENSLLDVAEAAAPEPDKAAAAVPAGR